MSYKTDFLVIGSGIAGLSFALKAAEKGRVTLISKVDIEESNTKYAQGGVASVMYEPDSIEKHVEDTLKAGHGYCNEEVVRVVVSEGPARIRELVEMGVDFDRRQDGQFDLAREGGHTEHRVLHHKDNTGEAIESVLVKNAQAHPNIEIFENHFAIDILTQHHAGELVNRSRRDIDCYGAYVFDSSSGEVKTIVAKVTVMATGGIGNLYQTTTNPVIATGDGVAMVYRAKGLIENMEFIQFHPTSLYNPNERPSFLITEALRGFGGVLRDWSGREFMDKYHPMGSLAPRDIVARAIDNEMKVRGDDHVFLDCTHLDAEKLRSHFPNITRKCLDLGIDITSDRIPVIPAAHYMCGGIKVDLNGESSIRRLYALGEVSSTGLHGANRLASNSLIEALVFAERAFLHSSARLSSLQHMEGLPEWDFEGTSHPEELVLVTQNYKEVQAIMSNYVGIVRSDLRLNRALKRLVIIFNETEDLYRKSTLSRRLCELRNLINAGYLVIKMANDRHQSLGLHYNIDYPPETSSEF
ncbi:MAG: L-aspartate oxidase [Bacteroidales bacterium]|nr:L-aspartate oxidase [Bacteroidales bacterium]